MGPRRAARGRREAAPEPVIVWCFWTALTLAPMARATSSSVHAAPTPASAKKVASQTEVVETRQRLGLRLIERPGFGQFEFKVEVATGVPCAGIRLRSPTSEPSGTVSRPARPSGKVTSTFPPNTRCCMGRGRIAPVARLPTDGLRQGRSSASPWRRRWRPQVLVALPSEALCGAVGGAGL